jgi:hypothetical protein
MSPEERERMQYLCQRIATEEEPQIFDQLVIELNDLLEVRHVRIHPEHKRRNQGDRRSLFIKNGDFSPTTTSYPDVVKSIVISTRRKLAA